MPNICRNFVGSRRICPKIAINTVFQFFFGILFDREEILVRKKNHVPVYRYFAYQYGTAKVAGALEQLETETNSWKADKAQYATFTTNLKEKMSDQANLKGAIQDLEERAEELADETEAIVFFLTPS